MGFFDFLQPILGAASFIPGPHQAITGGLSALIGGVGQAQAAKSARNQAKKYASQQEALIAEQQKWADEIGIPILKAYLAKAGWDPVTQTLNTKDPYADVVNPFRANLPSLSAKFTEDEDISADQAINALKADFAGMGRNPNDAALIAASNLIRSNAMTNAIGARRDLGVKANEWESNRQMAGIDEAWRRTLGAVDAARFGGDLIGAPLSGIGGLGQIAQARSDAATANLSGIIGTVGTILGSKGRPRDAGDNTLGTNQVGTPIGGPRGGASPGVADVIRNPADPFERALPVAGVIQEQNRRYNPNARRAKRLR